MRKIERIYVHCTASEWGNLEEVRRWHLDRGWQDIGYHYLIGNQFPTYSSYKDGPADPDTDGRLWAGRPLEIVGAHVRGDNRHTVGVALVGNEVFSQKQVDTLIHTCADLCTRFGLGEGAVRGHNEYWKDRGQEPQKSCPNLAMPLIRREVGLLMHAETAGITPPVEDPPVHAAYA